MSLATGLRNTTDIRTTFTGWTVSATCIPTIPTLCPQVPRLRATISLAYISLAVRVEASSLPLCSTFVRHHILPSVRPLMRMHQGTVHAREWITTMVSKPTQRGLVLNEILATNTCQVVEYAAYALLTNYSTDLDENSLLEKYDYYIFPIVNPDGKFFQADHIPLNIDFEFTVDAGGRLHIHRARPVVA